MEHDENVIQYVTNCFKKGELKRSNKTPALFSQEYCRKDGWGISECCSSITPPKSITESITSQI